MPSGKFHNPDVSLIENIASNSLPYFQAIFRNKLVTPYTARQTSTPFPVERVIDLNNPDTIPFFPAGIIQKGDNVSIVDGTLQFKKGIYNVYFTFRVQNLVNGQLTVFVPHIAETPTSPFVYGTDFLILERINGVINNNNILNSSNFFLRSSGAAQLFFGEIFNIGPSLNYLSIYITKLDDEI